MEELEGVLIKKDAFQKEIGKKKLKEIKILEKK